MSYKNTSLGGTKYPNNAIKYELDIKNSLHQYIILDLNF